MRSLTQRQKMVLDYIKKNIDTQGYPPTIREIGKHMHIRSTNGVADHLLTLERKGFIKREGHQSRAIRVIGKDSLLGLYRRLRNEVLATILRQGRQYINGDEIVQALREIGLKANHDQDTGDIRIPIESIWRVLFSS